MTDGHRTFFAVGNREQAYVIAVFRNQTFAEGYARDWNANPANMRVTVMPWSLPKESLSYEG